MSTLSADIIAAIATPPGRGGVGIVRLSGKNLHEIANTLTQKKLSPRHATYAKFRDENGDVIDEGIALFFPAPHSFTGEDVLELQGHGGPIVMQGLLQRAVQLGARLAKPGEFSERAFLNDKIDLTQAEAIADLINANSDQAARCAMRSLQGDFSKTVHNLVDELTQLRLFVEAAIDFPDEDIDFINSSDVKKRLQQVISKIDSVKATAKQGTLLQEGLTVVIAGKPNAGKSSLLNCLSGREVAIVTEIAGTTRDVLREYIHIDGMPLHIIDTAGLRDSEDIVEQEGMRRAWSAMESADIVLLVSDITDTTDNVELPFAEKLPANIPIVMIKNKIDLSKDAPQIKQTNNTTEIYLSAKNNTGIDILKKYLKDIAGFHANTEGLFIARRRHLDAIAKAQALISNGLTQLNSHNASELLAEDLRLAQLALAEITGEFTSDDLLGKIFSEFCIGK